MPAYYALILRSLTVLEGLVSYRLGDPPCPPANGQQPSLNCPPDRTCGEGPSSCPRCARSAQALTADPNYKLIAAAYPYMARRLLTDPAPELR